MEYILETQDLTKVYGTKEAAKDINLHIREGQIYGLIGRNGAGKTTIMRMISGLSTPTSGSYSLFGKTGYARGKILKNVGVLIESPGIYPKLSAYENLKIKCIAMGIRPNGYVEELLKTVGLENTDKKKHAGQMPKKGFSILSRYIASVPHNLTFLLVDILGNLIGNLFLRKITMDGSLVEAVEIFLLRLLLLQGITAILLLITSAFRSKSFGMILAVLLGLPLMWLIYSAINSGLEKIIKNANIIPYMPDQVIRESTPDAVRGFLVAAVTIAIFLPVSIRVFDQKDVK